MAKPQRLKSGNWRIQWTNSTGKRRGRTFASQSAAKKALRTREVEVDEAKVGEGKPNVELPTFEDFARERFLKRVQRECKPSEYRSVESILRVHLFPAVGHKRLDKVGASDGEQLKLALYDLGRKPKTIGNILVTLTRVLRYAVSPCELLLHAPIIKPPKSLREERRQRRQGIRPGEYLEHDEFNSLVDAATDKRLRVMVLLAGRAGLRVGELRALKWADIDHKANKIHFRRSDFRGILGLPKSGVTRTVPLAGRIRDALSELERGTPGAFLFPARSGKPVGYKVVTAALIEAGLRGELAVAVTQKRRQLDHRKAYKLRKRPGLTEKQTAWLATYRQEESPGFGWHTLRHTFCSHLATRGTPAIKIKQWAGHASTTTTDIYMHLAPSADQAVDIDLLDSPIQGPTAIADGRTL